MGLAIEIGIAKVGKFASRESGDTAEVAERPGGGVSIVVVDGQGSGAAAKSLSLLLTAKAIALLKEGVRDGAVARAVHDSLLAYRGGKVSASLDILSADLKHRDLVVTRNGTSPAVVVSGGEATLLPAEQGAIGIYPFTRPGVSRFPLDDGLQVWIVTDGVTRAGRRQGLLDFDLREHVQAISNAGGPAIDQAERLLAVALEADHRRPADDMTVATMRVTTVESDLAIRRLHMEIPIV